MTTMETAKKKYQAKTNLLEGHYFNTFDKRGDSHAVITPVSERNKERIEKIKTLYAELFPHLTVSDEDALTTFAAYRISEIESALRISARKLPQDPSWNVVFKYASICVRNARRWESARQYKAQQERERQEQADAHRANIRIIRATPEAKVIAYIEKHPGAMLQDIWKGLGVTSSYYFPASYRAAEAEADAMLRRMRGLRSKLDREGSEFLNYRYFVSTPEGDKERADARQKARDTRKAVESHNKALRDSDAFVQYVRQHPGVNSHDVAVALGTTDATAQQNLSHALNNGRVRRERTYSNPYQYFVCDEGTTPTASETVA